MAEEPDRIRDDIELTRARLAHDVDRLADKTSPGRVARRGWHNTKARVRGVTERVMGSAQDGGSAVRDTTSNAAGTVRDKASDAAETVRDKASDAAEAVRDKASGAVDSVRETAGDVAERVQRAPAAARRQAQGNPVAAGLIAFGAGLLAASLIPPTELEKKAGRQLRDHASDLVEPVKAPLAEAARDLSGSAKEAVAAVGDTAKEAAQQTADAAKSTARDASAEVKQKVTSS